MKSEVNPPLFTLVDLLQDKVPGHFYEQELVRAPNVNYNKHFFEVEEILKTKKVKSKTFYYVKYVFYPKKFNEWIPAENLKQLNDKLS